MASHRVGLFEVRQAGFLEEEVDLFNPAIGGSLAPAIDKGVVGPSLMPSHTLTLTSAFGLTNAGVFPSVRVLLRSFPRYYNPLGLPLQTARLRLGLIRGRSL